MKTLAITLISAAALLLPLQASAEDDQLLASLVGEWTGNGKIRLAPDADPERIFCRITNTLVEDGRVLEQKGRCGVATNTGSVDGLIRALGDGNYEGTLESLASRGAAALTGAQDTSENGESQLILTAAFTDSQTGRPAVSITTLTVLEDGGYHMKSDRADPDGTEYAESQILFARR